MRLYIDYVRGVRPALLPVEIRQLLAIRDVSADLMARQRRLLALAKGWRAIAALYRAKCDLNRVLRDRPATRNLISEGIRRIVSTTAADFRGFPSLIQSLVQFHTISLELNLGTPLLCSIIAQMPCEALLIPFMVLAGTIGQNAAEFLTPAQNLAWDTIGACLMKMAQEDETLVQRFLEESALMRKR
jgi:hypothetical protein